MKKEFNFVVKIVDDGNNTEITSSISGSATGENILTMLLETVPELLDNDLDIIDFFCFILSKGIKPSNEGVGKMTKIDLSGLVNGAGR